MKPKTTPMNLSMAFHSPKPNLLLLILIELLLKTWRIVKRNSDIIVLDAWVKVLQRLGLRIAMRSFESSERVIGERVNKFMNAKIKYSNEPVGKVEVIADMLPSPEELAFKEDTVKVTIALSKSSVDFFKKEAKKHDTKYQQMIRRLLDEYTQMQGRHITNHSTRTPTA